MSTVVSDRDVGSEEVALGSMGFWIIELTSPSVITVDYGDACIQLFW